MVDEKYYNLSCFVSVCGVYLGFFHLHVLFTWCGIVSHQQILMVMHVAQAEIIGAANAAPAAPVSTPMCLTLNFVSYGMPFGMCRHKHAGFSI